MPSLRLAMDSNETSRKTYSMSAGNSMVVSDTKFDDYHAHRCIECAAMFGRMNPVAEETSDGNLCADCAAEREMRKDDE